MTGRIIKTAVTAAVIAAAGIAAAIWLNSGKKEKITVDEARINEVKTMVRLCTMEIYREVPVIDTIGDKMIVAVQKQQGSIHFDAEHLDIDDTGDTVRVTLPKERVEIMESTEDNSWEVIDTKNIGFLGAIRNDHLSPRDENRVKAKLKREAVRKLYEDGTVGHARVQAAKSLETMLGKLYRKPVVVGGI